MNDLEISGSSIYIGIKIKIKIEILPVFKTFAPPPTTTTSTTTVEFSGACSDQMNQVNSN